MKRFLACFVAVALLALTASACSSTLSDAATINYSLSGKDHEDHVTRADLLNEVNKIADNEPFAKWLSANGYPMNGDVTTGTAVSSTWLGQLIRQKAIDALFNARHLTVSPSIRERATEGMPQLYPTADVFPAFDSKYREELIDREARREALAASFLNISDAAGEKYFDAHQSQFACASGKDVAQILVKTEAKAQDLLDQLQNGASFGELAKANSTDTGSAKLGGALGCLTPNTFAPPFQKAADSATVGTPVGPVHTQFGYHDILVTPADLPTYGAVKPQVQQALAQQAQTEALADLTNVLKSFKVHVDPRFGTWTANDGHGQTYVVVPPNAPKPSAQREGTTTTTTPAIGLPNGAG